MTEQPISDLNLQLKGILGWIQSKKEESQKQGKSWSWVFSAIASALVFFSLAFVAYESWKKGKEIAKLKHDIDVKEEETKLAEANKQIATCVHRVKELNDQIDKNVEQVGQIKSHILELELQRKTQHEKIDKITSWEDVTNILLKK